MAELINFYVIPGIVIGSIYALIAIGITMTFGVMRFANFSHGETMTIGAYLVFALVTGAGMGFVPATAIAAVATVITALLVDRFFFRPLRGAPPIILMIASFGVMLMLRSAVQFTWGVNLRMLYTGIDRPWVVFGLSILPRHALIITTAAILALCLHLLLSRTRIGTAMRAVSDAPQLASIVGIRTEAVIAATWAVGAVLACIAGVLLAVDTQLDTQLGFRMMLPAFAAVILGGIGRPFGAILAALVIGIAEELTSFPWTGTQPLISPSYKGAVSFVLLIAILLWRPTGLLKGTTGTAGGSG